MDKHKTVLSHVADARDILLSINMSNNLGTAVTGFQSKCHAPVVDNYFRHMQKVPLKEDKVSIGEFLKTMLERQ